MKSISFTFLIYCIYIRQCRRIVKIFYPRRIERIKAFQARLVLDFATGPVSWGTHNDQDDLRRRSVIECLARYQLPLRHRPCNNSRSSEYKVNISCYVSTLYHYLFFFFFFADPVDRRRSTTLRRARSIVSLFFYVTFAPYYSLPFHHPVCLCAFMSTLHVMINRSFFVADESSSK